MLQSIHLSHAALAGLRARALAGGPGSLPPPPAARPRRWSPYSQAGATAAFAEATRPPSRGSDVRGSSERHEGQAALQRAVRAALDAGRPEVAAHLLADEWAFTSRCLEDEQLSKELVLGLVRGVNTAAALAALPMVTASVGLLAQAILAAQERGSVKGIRALLAHAEDAELAGGPAARELWQAAIVALGALRRPDEARAAFVRMRGAGAWDPSDTPTVNLLLNTLAGDVRLQFIRFNQLRREGVAPDASTINCLLKGCMRARDMRRAALALRWAAEAGLAADEITWNTLIKIHSYADDFDGVLAVWRRMQASGFAPTPRLWGSLLLACSAAGQLEQCHIFWWEMKALHSQQLAAIEARQAQEAEEGGGPGGQPPGALPGTGGTTSTSGEEQAAAADGQPLAGDAGGEAGGGAGGNGSRRRGRSRARKRKWQGGSGGVLTTDNVCAMMTACNDAGQYERALTAFGEARGLGVPMDTRAFNIALKACHTPGKTLRQEQLVQAFSLYDDLKRSGLAPDAYTFATLFELCAAAKQGRAALQLYGEMAELGVLENVVCLTSLCKAVGATPGMAHECIAVLRRMARGPARTRPNQCTFRTVIAALREQGELAEALRVYARMRRLYPADNSEFEGLTAIAAERALANEDAELRAAVAEVCAITSTRSLDLHGMSTLEARAAVLCVLAMLQQQHKEGRPIDHDCVVITGRGRGSRGGEPVVRQEVLALLQRLGFPLPLAAANPGRVVLPGHLLTAALRARAERRAVHSAGGTRDAGGAGDGAAAAGGAPPAAARPEDLAQ